MQKAREVKRRIRSVENTAQITRTMEMVAAAKLKKAADRVYASRPYSESLAAIVRSLYAPELAPHYPLLREPEETRREGILLLTSDRGLCGAFNANLIRKTRDLMDELEEAGVGVELHVAGRKGIQYFSFRDFPMASTHVDLEEPPTVEEAETLVDPLREGFREGRLDGVHVVASFFHSALSTPPKVTRLLPLERPGEAAVPGENYLYSPTRERILERVLPLYVRNEVYRALLENAAGEQGARRTAMKNATDNAEDMLEDLKRSYNRARQAQITQEIAEIVGGAEGLQ